MSTATLTTDTRSSSIRRSLSMPLLDSQNDQDRSYSIGSCGNLEALIKSTNAQQRFAKVSSKSDFTIISTKGDFNLYQIPYEARLVTDFRQLVTLRQHYYPEGKWGWIVLCIVCIVQCISHGFHLSVGVFALEMTRQGFLNERAGNWTPQMLNRISLCYSHKASLCTVPKFLGQIHTHSFLICVIRKSFRSHAFMTCQREKDIWKRMSRYQITGNKTVKWIIAEHSFDSSVTRNDSDCCYDNRQ
jgi:hypothetical protein